MPTPIVPLDTPTQSRHFERTNRNAILLKIRLGKVELTFFQSVNQEML